VGRSLGGRWQARLEVGSGATVRPGRQGLKHDRDG
jgi:hypothetical protein